MQTLGSPGSAGGSGQVSELCADVLPDFGPSSVFYPRGSVMVAVAVPPMMSPFL